MAIGLSSEYVARRPIGIILRKARDIGSTEQIKTVSLAWTIDSGFMRAGIERAYLGRGASATSPFKSAEGGRIDRYREWLNHNELELGLDDLEGLGANNPLPREFWVHLRDAAEEMRLERHALRMDKRLSSSAG